MNRLYRRFDPTKSTRNVGSHTKTYDKKFQFEGRLIVVFETQMSDQVLAAHMPQRVLQLHQLDENVVLGIKTGSRLRRFEVEREPLLNTLHAGTLSQIEEEREVQTKRRGEDRIAA